MQNLKKIARADPELRRHIIFWAQKHPIALDQFFFQKKKDIISIHFLASFIVPNSKKILRGDPDLYPMRHFLGPK